MEGIFRILLVFDAMDCIAIIIVISDVVQRRSYVFSYICCMLFKSEE